MTDSLVRLRDDIRTSDGLRAPGIRTPLGIGNPRRALLDPWYHKWLAQTHILMRHYRARL